MSTDSKTFFKVVCRRNDGKYVKRWEDRSGPGSSSGVGFCDDPLDADGFSESCLGHPAAYALRPYNDQRGFEDCAFIKLHISASWSAAG